MIQHPTAVSGVNNNRTEPSELTQERSIFEHVNGNLRPSVILSQNHVNGNVPNGTGTIDKAVEARVATNTIRVTVGEEKQETTGMRIYFGYVVTVCNPRGSSQIYWVQLLFISLLWCTADCEQSLFFLEIRTCVAFLAFFLA